MWNNIRMVNEIYIICQFVQFKTMMNCYEICMRPEFFFLCNVVLKSL